MAPRRRNNTTGADGAAACSELAQYVEATRRKGKGTPQPECLRPYQFTSDQDHDKCVANGHKGGIASGIARRERRRFSDVLAALSVVAMRDDKGNIEKNPYTGEEMSVQEAVVVSLLRRAIFGDVTAIRTIMECFGELKNVQDLNVAGQQNTAIQINIAPYNQEQSKK